jgi:hypothetical protein
VSINDLRVYGAGFAYCLMVNHRLLVESPKANLSIGYAAAKRHIHAEFQPPPSKAAYILQCELSLSYVVAYCLSMCR